MTATQAELLAEVALLGKEKQELTELRSQQVTVAAQFVAVQTELDTERTLRKEEVQRVLTC